MRGDSDVQKLERDNTLAKIAQSVPQHPYTVCEWIIGQDRERNLTRSCACVSGLETLHVPLENAYPDHSARVGGAIYRR